MSSEKVRACVLGATGYTGIELVGLLTKHPNAELLFATSESYTGQSLGDVAPGSPAVDLVSAKQARFDDVDFAFLCLPHAAAAPTALAARKAGCRVIDLSADFRLRDADVYESWYGVKHPDAGALAGAVYGLTEDVRAMLPEAGLVANPGCYATSILLALLPLLKSDIAIDTTIIADSKSGVTGAGRAPKVGSLFAEVAENFAPYKIGRSHRHLPEIEQQMHSWRAAAPPLLFSPHLLPVKRGILSTIYVPNATERPLDQVHQIFTSAYDGEPFVNVLPLGKLPSLAHVVGTNRCTMGLASAGNMLIVTSAIDNLLKGAAGQAVQNMNAMVGLPETTGLPS